MSPQNDHIDEIIRIEWDMFQQVNEDGPRASCQDDPITFRGMRAGQFRAWSDQALQSYLADLHEAQRTGRNLIKEKYLYMMAESDPSILEKLSVFIQIPGQEVFELVDGLIRIIFQETIQLYLFYPLVTQTGRPLVETGNEWSATSVMVYQRCELLTYSLRTLEALVDHVVHLVEQGESFAELVLSNTVQYYGYKDLESAEDSLRARQGSGTDRISLASDTDPVQS